MIVPGRNMIVNSAARHRLAHISGSLERLDVIVEPDPVRRLVGQELVVGEAQPEDAEDRPDLIADEEGERRQQEQPLPTPCRSSAWAARPSPAEAHFAGYDRLRHALSQLNQSASMHAGSACRRASASPSLPGRARLRSNSMSRSRASEDRARAAPVLAATYD